MDVRIEIIQEKKLLGKYIIMSLTNNKTYDLWHSFMMERTKIRNAVSKNLYSIQTYDSIKDPYNIHAKFIKWAAVEVSDFNDSPSRMHALLLEGGLYAIFLHKGAFNDHENTKKTFTYIFTEWLPQSKYQLDHRPHFELLGNKYNKDDANSEEEIWIPIKLL